MESGSGGGGDIFHPLLPAASSSSSSASRVSVETPRRGVGGNCPGRTHRQPRPSEKEEQETLSPHDHRPGFPVLCRDQESLGCVSLSTASSSTRAPPRRTSEETSLSSENQRGRPLTWSSSSYTTSSSRGATSSHEEREHDEKEEKTMISGAPSLSRDKVDSRRTGNTTPSVWAGSETKHHHHTVSVQSSDYVAVTEAASTPGRACFICLEGVKRRKRDRKLVRDLLPCCSQCYAVVHQKCW